MRDFRMSDLGSRLNVKYIYPRISLGYKSILSKEINYIDLNLLPQVRNCRFLSLNICLEVMNSMIITYSAGTYIIIIIKWR